MNWELLYFIYIPFSWVIIPILSLIAGIVVGNRMKEDEDKITPLVNGICYGVAGGLTTVSLGALLLMYIPATYTMAMRIFTPEGFWLPFAARYASGILVFALTTLYSANS